MTDPTRRAWTAHNRASGRAKAEADAVSRLWAAWRADPRPDLASAVRAGLSRYHVEAHRAATARVSAELASGGADPDWAPYHDANEATRDAIVAGPAVAAEAAKAARAAAERALATAERATSQKAKHARRAADAALEAAAVAESRIDWPELGDDEAEPDESAALAERVAAWAVRARAMADEAEAIVAVLRRGGH